MSQEEINEMWREVWAVHRVLVRMHGEKHCKNARPWIISDCDCAGTVARQKLGPDYSLSEVICECGSNLWQEKMTGFVCAKCRTFTDWYQFREMRRKQRTMGYTLPPLIISKGIIGYDSDLLSAHLGKKFDEWMRGQTIMGYTKKDGTQGMLVYQCDVETYLAGLPPLD